MPDNQTFPGDKTKKKDNRNRLSVYPDIELTRKKL